MNLLRLILFANRNRRLSIIVAVILSGLSPVAGMAVVNMVVGEQFTHQIPWGILLIFVAIIVCIIVSYIVSTRIAVANVEAFLADWRTDVHDRVRRLEFNDFERLGETDIYDSVTRNTAAVSSVGDVVAFQTGTVIALVAACIYTIFLSVWAFIIYLLVFGLGTFAMLVSRQRIRRGVGAANKDETRYLSLLGQLLGGFKEVRLNEARGNDLKADFLEPASHALQTERIKVGGYMSAGGAIVHGMIWASMGIVVFVLPLSSTNETVIIQAVYVGVLLRGFLVAFLANLPQLTAAESALSDLTRVNRMLESAEHDIEREPRPTAFHSIEMKNVVFSYRGADGEPGFTVGPINLSLSQGELLFIVGENGGGKSTILKLLCRLYPQDAGEILLDGKPVDDSALSSYRALFTVVLANFHLFDRLYGMPDCTDAEANALLEELGIGHKVQVVDGAFSTMDLSSGQRQRLALAVAILEDRPIMVLDEIAADQDPEFRARLYRTILPRLTQTGRTLVVVSHDNRYFDVADKVVTIAGGHISNPA